MRQVEAFTIARIVAVGPLARAGRDLFLALRLDLGLPSNIPYRHFLQIDLAAGATGDRRFCLFAFRRLLLWLFAWTENSTDLLRLA